MFEYQKQLTSCVVNEEWHRLHHKGETYLIAIGEKKWSIG